MTAKLTGWLRDARIAGWVALLPLVYFAAEWIVAATWRGRYDYDADLLGPLGVAFCGPDGRWPCSALYPAMNAALVVTGLAIMFVAAGFAARRVTQLGHAVLLLIAGAGLAVSGIVTNGVHYAWNLTAISVFLTFGSVSVLFIAMDSTCSLSGERRGVAVVAGIVSVVGYFAYLGQHELVGAGGAQRMAIYGILVAVIALGTSGLRRDPQAHGSGSTPVETVRGPG